MTALSRSDRRGRRYRLAFLLLLAGFGAPAPVLAQEQLKSTRNLDSDRPEAWAMNYFTSITLLSGLSMPHSRAPGSIEIALELGRIPQLSESERRIGFDGRKEEDLNKSPVFGRPRITIGLPWRSALIVSYIPPVRLYGLKPHIVTIALERPLLESGPWTLGARLYGQLGTVRGAFTCPDEVTAYPPGAPGNPYGCDTQSNDKAYQHYAGFELSGAYRIERLGGLTPYVTVGANYLNPKVQVHAQVFGRADRTRLDADTGTVSAGLGLIYALDERFTLSAGAFYSPLEVTRPPSTSSNNDPLINFRTQISYRFR